MKEQMENFIFRTQKERGLKKVYTGPQIDQKRTSKNTIEPKRKFQGGSCPMFQAWR